MGKRKFERMAASCGESTAARRSRSIGFAQTLVEDHPADDLAQPLAAGFLSHQQTIGTTPTACIPFTVLSQTEFLHILLEHLYDSQRNKNAGLSSPTSSATASREKPGSVQSAPTVPAAACRRRIGCTPRRKDPGGLPRLRRSWQGPPRGTGSKPYPRCLASGSSDRTVRQWGWPPPFRSAPRRLATPTLSSRWGSAAAELSSRRVG
jgi:hypothetical protein